MNVEDIQSNEPIKTADGSLGLVIRFDDNEIGVQVPGEEEIRYIFIDRVSRIGGALIEVNPAEKLQMEMMKKVAVKLRERRRNR